MPVSRAFVFNLPFRCWPVYNRINKDETFGGETIETAPKLKMSYAPEVYLYIGGLGFEMPFPMKKKKSLKWWLGSQTNQRKSVETIISLWSTFQCNTELE